MPAADGQRVLLMFAEAGVDLMNALQARSCIDVTNRKTWVQKVSPEFLKRYLGGVGLATRLVYDNTPRGCDPLGPDNALCFACSAFAGTTMPVGTKHGVASKSPLTGMIGDSLSGSHFSEMLRRAGWDGIVIKVHR